MKKILFILLLFLVGTTYAQKSTISRSNWNSAKIDAWAAPPGGAIFDGDTQYYSIPDNANLGFGTGDFSIGLVGDIPSIVSGTLVHKKVGTNESLAGWYIQVRSPTAIRFHLADGTTFIDVQFVMNLNSLLKHFIIDRADSLCSYYEDGVFINSIDISSVTGSVDNSGNLTIFNRDGFTNPVFGNLYSLSIFNSTLSQAEVKGALNNGEPHLAATEFKYQGANNDLVATYDTSQAVSDAFVLTTNKAYTWIKGNADSVIINSITYISDTTITVLVTSGTAYGDLTNSFLNLAGEVLNLPYNKAGVNGWVDISGNNLNANSTGSPIAPLGLRDFRGAVGADYVLANTAHAGHILKYVIITNNTGTTQDIDLGTSAGGTQIISDQTVAGNTTVTVSIGDYFGALDTLYINDGTSTWQSNVDMTLIYEAR